MRDRADGGPPVEALPDQSASEVLSSVEDEGSSNTTQAHLSAPGLKSGKSMPGGVGPGATSFFQGASNFGVEQANINQHIDNLRVVTTTISKGAGDARGLGYRSISLEASHTTSCACGTSSSQVVTTVNTPGHQVRFEVNQREVALNHREREVQQRELDLAGLELALRRASLEPREPAISAKERALEESIASADLTAIFGADGSRGVVHVLQDFAVFQREPGEKRGRFIKLHTRFVPHYGAVSKPGVASLSDSVKVATAKVVKSLHAEQKKLRKLLTFEAIRTTLTQLIFLEPRPEYTTNLRRTVKISESAPIPAFLTQSQWIVKLIESDTPESVLDLEASAFAPKRKKKGRGFLTFPCAKVPRFKLSNIQLMCVVAKKTGISAQKKAGVDLEYRAHTYGLPEDLILELSPEARSRDYAYTHALFS